MILKSLKEAIEHRKTICLIYKGTERIVEPYIVGLNKTKKEVLIGYQTGGLSSSGSLPAWRQFILNDIDSIEISTEVFEVHPEYNPNDNQILEFIFRVH